MIDYRLLIDLEAVVELDGLAKRDRGKLCSFSRSFASIQSSIPSAMNGTTWVGA